MESGCRKQVLQGKEQGPWRRERGCIGGHQGTHAGTACHNGGTSTAPPPADTAQRPEAHAPNTRRRSTNRTPYRPHRLTPTGHRKPHKGRRAHPHGVRGLHPQRKTLRTPQRSPPPRPHRQATRPATSRATSKAPKEEEGEATAPVAGGKNPQRAGDQSTGAQGGQPRGHPPDQRAPVAHPDHHSTGRASHSTPNRTPQPPASHTLTRTAHHDTGRTNHH